MRVSYKSKNCISDFGWVGFTVSVVPGTCVIACLATPDWVGWVGWTLWAGWTGWAGWFIVGTTVLFSVFVGIFAE